MERLLQSRRGDLAQSFDGSTIFGKVCGCTVGGQRGASASLEGWEDGISHCGCDHEGMQCERWVMQVDVSNHRLDGEQDKDDCCVILGQITYD